MSAILTLMLIAIEAATALLCQREEKASKPATPWLKIQVESAADGPESPEQVCITVRTRDGRKWLATWEQQAEKKALQSADESGILQHETTRRTEDRSHDRNDAPPILLQPR